MATLFAQLLFLGAALLTMATIYLAHQRKKELEKQFSDLISSSKMQLELESEEEYRPSQILHLYKRKYHGNPSLMDNLRHFADKHLVIFALGGLTLGLAVAVIVSAFLIWMIWTSGVDLLALFILALFLTVLMLNEFLTLMRVTSILQHHLYKEALSLEDKKLVLTTRRKWMTLELRLIPFLILFIIAIGFYETVRDGVILMFVTATFILNESLSSILLNITPDSASINTWTGFASIFITIFIVSMGLVGIVKTWFQVERKILKALNYY